MKTMMSLVAMWLLFFPPLHLHVLSNFLDKFENPNMKIKTQQGKNLGHSKIVVKELWVAVSSILGAGSHVTVGAVCSVASTQSYAFI